MKVILAFAVIGMILIASPLGDLATSRFSHKTGDTGRVQRDLGAQEKIADSPILGFGAPLGAVQTPTHKSPTSVPRARSSCSSSRTASPGSRSS